MTLNWEFGTYRVCSKGVVRGDLQWIRSFSTLGQNPALNLLQLDSSQTVLDGVHMVMFSGAHLGMIPLTYLKRAKI